MVTATATRRKPKANAASTRKPQSPKPNRHGVYTVHETVTIPTAKSRGITLKIHLLELSAGKWIAEPKRAGKDKQGVKAKEGDADIPPFRFSGDRAA